MKNSLMINVKKDFIHNAGSHNPQDADASCARAVQE